MGSGRSMVQYQPKHFCHTDTRKQLGYMRYSKGRPKVSLELPSNFKLTPQPNSIKKASLHSVMKPKHMEQLSVPTAKLLYKELKQSMTERLLNLGVR